MRLVVFCSVIYIFTGCTTASSKMDYSFSEIVHFKPNTATKNEILARFGEPDEKEVVPRKKEEFEGPLEYWGYKQGEIVRLHITFIKEILQSIAYDIDEEDPEFKLQTLLNKVDGRFRIIKEPVRNPHSMPTKCYLVDETKGISILVNAYKKAPSFVSFWNPAMGKNRKWFDDSTPEFCIAGQCSRITEPKAWNHNHCDWLEKVVAKAERTAGGE